MISYLVDTNVVSELSKRSPNPSVTGFLAAQDDLWLSVIVVAELEMGVQSLPEGRRRDALRDWLFQIKAAFDQRILPIAQAEAEWAATFRVRAQRDGGALNLADALIAGTAMANNMTIATRNTKDFSGLGIAVLNPWAWP